MPVPISHTLLSYVPFVIVGQRSDQYRCPNTDRRRTQAIVPFSGRCYQFVHEERYWTSARDYCRDVSTVKVHLHWAKARAWETSHLGSRNFSWVFIWKFLVKCRQSFAKLAQFGNFYLNMTKRSIFFRKTRLCYSHWVAAKIKENFAFALTMIIKTILMITWAHCYCCLLHNHRVHFICVSFLDSNELHKCIYPFVNKISTGYWSELYSMF